MNSSSTPSPRHQRKTHYIDHLLQKWLLIALVVLEITVLSVAGAILYARLNTIVDESLYRVHFAGQPSMFSVLFKESLLIIAGLLAANLAALFAADRIWSHYVHGILLTLRGLLTRTGNLDLREDAKGPQRHQVLALALAWREAERRRHQALRAALDRLANDAADASTADETFRASLLTTRARLPDVRISDSGPASGP